MTQPALWADLAEEAQPLAPPRPGYIPVVRTYLVQEGTVRAQDCSTKSPADAADLLARYFAGWDREGFVVLLLNVKNHVVGLSMVSMGGLSSCPIHPREVFKPAILASAGAVILAHNHPSGDPTPSREDIEVTRRLKDVLAAALGLLLVRGDPVTIVAGLTAGLLGLLAGSLKGA